MKNGENREHPLGGAIYIEFAVTGDSEAIRKWSRHPFEGALRFDHRLTQGADSE